VLAVVLPKGSLEKQVLDLFSSADLRVLRGSDRDYHARIDDPRIDKVRFLRPQEIPTYVEQGIFDLGISGRDWVAETGADVVSLGEIGGGRAGEKTVRVVLAVPKESPWESAADLPDGVRISTEMPELTRRYLAEHGVNAKVFTSHGATEAKIPDIVDAIVDLTETGSSLRKAGLKIIATLLTSRTELLANREAYEDPAKRAAMGRPRRAAAGCPARAGHGAAQAQRPAGQPGRRARRPAGDELAHRDVDREADVQALETVVPKQGVNRLIPSLKAAGGARHPRAADLEDRGVVAAPAPASTRTEQQQASRRTTAALAVAVLSGALVALQQRINGQLGVDLQAPLLAALGPFGTGSVAWSPWCCPAPPAGRPPVREVPWWTRLGGLRRRLARGGRRSPPPQIGVAAAPSAWWRADGRRLLSTDRARARRAAPAHRPRVRGAVLCWRRRAGSLGATPATPTVLLSWWWSPGSHRRAAGAQRGVRRTTGNAAVATLVNFVVGTAALSLGVVLMALARGLPTPTGPGSASGTCTSAARSGRPSWRSRPSSSAASASCGSASRSSRAAGRRARRRPRAAVDRRRHRAHHGAGGAPHAARVAVSGLGVKRP
jgi:ATP phosphoribosyltransferase